MKNFKKIVSAVLSVFITFSAANASSESTVSSNPNLSYKILDDKNAVLTELKSPELKSSQLKKLSDPVEGRYNIVEVSDNASKARVVAQYYGYGDVILFWIAATAFVCSPFFLFSGFFFDNPDNIPKVGKFKGNKNIYSGITSVDLPNCKRVGKNAFFGCNNLKTVSLPKCTVLEKGCLTCCNSVTKLNVPECLVLDNPFGIDTKYKISYDAWKDLKELNAQKCTKVEDRSFGGFMNLRKVNLPSAVSIGRESFALCRFLNDISLDSCVEIKEYAFKDCRFLRNINLPSCEKIGRGAFKKCCRLRKLNAPKLKEINADIFGFRRQINGKNYSFSNDLEELYIPNCTYIGDNAFSSCKKLKKITVSRDCKFGNNALPCERVQNNKLQIVKV